MTDITVEVNRDVMDQIKEQINARLEDVGFLVETYAKEYCPVDTGVLRASISSKVTQPEHKVTIGTNVEYAVYVHQGHHSYAGKPFLRDAVFNHTTEIVNILSRDWR